VEKSIYNSQYKKLMQSLKDARKTADVKQEEIAKILSFSQQDVSKYENCIRRLDIVEFLQICEILGIDYKEFLSETASNIKSKKKPSKG